MVKCRYPKCGKKLVGEEKHLCKSCKDKIKTKAEKTVKGIVVIATTVVDILKVVKGGNNDIT